MTKGEASAAAGLLRSILALLPRTAMTATSEEAADLRRLCGRLDADAEAKMQAGSFGADMAACFEAATDAGATVAAFQSVGRTVVADLRSTSGIPARAVAIAALRLVVIQQARIVGSTDFTSRDDVEKAQAVLNASFDAVIEQAADARDSNAYRALITLHATMTRDLQTRSRPLPRMVTYQGASVPSLVLANRLYGDAGRADELRAENRAPHPLFMAPTGRALSE